MVALVGRGRLWLRRAEPGSGGGRTCRRWGRRPSSVDCGLGELQRVGLRLPEGLGKLGGPIYTASRSVPRRPRISSTANRRSIACRTTWRRQVLADALLDMLGLPKGELARGCGSGGAVHGRSCRSGGGGLRRWRCRAPGGCQGGSAAREESGRVGCEWKGTRTGAERLQRDAATRAHARAKRALWPRLEHAREVLSKMPMPVRGL